MKSPHFQNPPQIGSTSDKHNVQISNGNTSGNQIESPVSLRSCKRKKVSFVIYSIIEMNLPGTDWRFFRLYHSCPNNNHL
jgi:hypothetical protein